MSKSDMRIKGPQIHQFNNIAPHPIPRSSFKRDFSVRTTFNASDLVPIICDEILPGDDISLGVNAMVRMTTPTKPIMDNLYLETFFFFVPNRLVWDNWQKFQGQIEPGDSTVYTIPKLDATKVPMTSTGFIENTTYDHMGMPTKVAGLGVDIPISALYNRAIWKIYNDWFRDESLQASLTVPTGDGPDDPAPYAALLQRNKRKDYFTSMLAAPQKGTAVSISLTGRAPVSGIGATSQSYSSSSGALYETGGSSSTTYAFYQPVQTPGLQAKGTAASGGYPSIYAELSGVSAVTINALRQAALYQQIFELDARAGTRYVESLYARWGVISPDFRLQRPELIGQGQSMVNVYAVPQTQATGASGTTTAQGNLAAFSATGITSGHSAKYSATEHGMLIGFANVRADLTYQQGLPKKYSRSTRLDYYEPMLNGLGEQAVNMGELYLVGSSADVVVVGYQERFAEYRFFNSEIRGLFRNNATGTLKVWHLSQQLSSPTLNSAFITEAVPMDQVLTADTSTIANFLADFHFAYNHVRAMPIRSNPGIDKL